MSSEGEDLYAFFIKLPQIPHHLLSALLGIVSGNDTGTGKKENSICKLHEFAYLRVGGRYKTHPPLSPF
jgi:hypothetical protein